MSLVNLFGRFAGPLDQLHIPYMATGAVAAIVFGEPRLTLDLDLVLRLGVRDVGRFAAAFPSAEFYVPPPETLEAEAERSMGTQPAEGARVTPPLGRRSPAVVTANPADVIAGARLFLP